jgi:hypothetical protein
MTTPSADYLLRLADDLAAAAQSSSLSAHGYDNFIQCRQKLQDVLAEVFDKSTKSQ